MPNPLRKTLLRECAREFDREPSDFFNALYAGSNTTVWLVSRELEVVWHSDNANEIMGIEESLLGLSYDKYLPSLAGVITSLSALPVEYRGTIHSACGKEFEIVCYPLSADGATTGYVVTLSEGFKAKLTQFLERQKLREERLCQIVSSVRLT